MKRATYRLCKCCRELHEMQAWPAECMAHWDRGQKSDLAMPMIISDHLADVVNPLDGKRYDSKSAYYRKVRESGCEIVGNEPMNTAPPVLETPGGVERDIADAIEQLGG